MHVRVLAIGGKTQGWVTEAWVHYAKRLPAAWRLEIVEIPSSRRSPRQPTTDVRAADGERLGSQLREEERVIALDERGRRPDSVGFAGMLEEWLGEGRDIAFVIGGADGLSQSFLDAADFRWSLSPLTFPHELVRAILAEQLYRAAAIIAGHPYHRA